MIKVVTHAHLGPIWYHSEPSDVHYSPNQFLGWDFFAVTYSKTAPITLTINITAELAKLICSLIYNSSSQPDFFLDYGILKNIP